MHEKEPIEVKNPTENEPVKPWHRKLFDFVSGKLSGKKPGVVAEPSGTAGSDTGVQGQQPLFQGSIAGENGGDDSLTPEQRKALKKANRTGFSLKSRPRVGKHDLEDGFINGKKNTNPADKIYDAEKMKMLEGKLQEKFEKDPNYKLTKEDIKDLKLTPQELKRVEKFANSARDAASRKRSERAKSLKTEERTAIKDLTPVEKEIFAQVLGPVKPSDLESDAAQNARINRMDAIKDAMTEVVESISKLEIYTKKGDTRHLPEKNILDLEFDRDMRSKIEKSKGEEFKEINQRIKTEGDRIIDVVLGDTSKLSEEAQLSFMKQGIAKIKWPTS